MSTIDALELLPPPVFTDPRRVSVDLHLHLRRLVFENHLPPGTVLKQAQLARIFGVSRTPMREAFRMLQEEGLIDTAVDQRARVRALDGDELDQLYSVRITLEALGARLTAGRLASSERTRALAALDTMERAQLDEDLEGWMSAHRRFHRVCVARADEPIVRVIDSYAQRSERYLRLYQLWHPQSFAIAHREHADILDAIVEGNVAKSGTRIADHLAHTSITVLADVAGGNDGRAIRHALAMVRDPRRGSI
ncbi:GntR family transcriptional regulator [Microbacterium sp. ARD31]|uniref:GntR family transcriptional regulator n=1 Tax=Microbacterium sp. ARD31 TaxID=2962576 RepID=UPI002881C695|nr:GntR family transcriptional regulator [Microbacterium sp. ARD31]MDT0183996.1 GntR family transcriptional regulator [Microbacterium sp. ARD31]